jgi:hypothetical protein
MMTLQAPHQRISSVPGLLVDQARLFPCGNQYITQAAITISGLDQRPERLRLSIL